MIPVSRVNLERYAKKNIRYLLYNLFRAPYYIDEFQIEEVRNRDELSNMLLDAFAMYLRCTLDFLYPSGHSEKEHVIGKHYLLNKQNASYWSLSTLVSVPAHLPELTKARRMANERVAHFSINRLQKEEWDISAILEELLPELLKFCDQADPQLLCSDTIDYLRRLSLKVFRDERTGRPLVTHTDSYTSMTSSYILSDMLITWKDKEV